MSLADLLDKPAGLAWRAGDPDSEEYDNCNPIFGRFLRLEQGNTNRGACFIAVIEKTDSEGNPTGEGERNIWLFHSVLKDRLARLKPRPGQLLAIRKDGTQPSKIAGNSDMQLYTVRSPESAGGEADWGAVIGQPSTEGSAVSPGQPVHTVYAEEAPDVPGQDDIPF